LPGVTLGVVKAIKMFYLASLLGHRVDLVGVSGA